MDKKYDFNEGEIYLAFSIDDKNQYYIREVADYSEDLDWENCMFVACLNEKGQGSLEECGYSHNIISSVLQEYEEISDRASEYYEKYLVVSTAKNNAKFSFERFIDERVQKLLGSFNLTSAYEKLHSVTEKSGHISVDRNGYGPENHVWEVVIRSLNRVSPDHTEQISVETKVTDKNHLVALVKAICLNEHWRTNPEYAEYLQRCKDRGIIK